MDIMDDQPTLPIVPRRMTFKYRKKKGKGKESAALKLSIMILAKFNTSKVKVFVCEGYNFKKPHRQVLVYRVSSWVWVY